MAKRKTAYVCNDCGADYSKWQGQIKFPSLQRGARGDLN